MMIHTTSLSIGYLHKAKPIVVQKDLNLELAEAEMLALIGPNGCGKSTLLRTLSGLQAPLKGSVLVGDKELGKLSMQEKAALFALVLTEPVQIGYCTVNQLVSMGRYPHTGRFGRLNREDHRMVDKALERVHLSDLAQRPLTELSDGERQRAMVAKALAQDTPLIFLDEPTAHLDLSNKVELMVLLKDLARDTGKTVLLSTHELELALHLSDRIWLMKPQAGGIEAGTPSELIAQQSLQHIFKNDLFGFEPETGRVLIF
ncbi:MAG: ABC transporter ATP-binding protein [Bacteroidales bacterium]